MIPRYKFKIMRENLITIGKVVKSQGNKGEILLKSLTDDPTRFERLETIYLQGKGLNKLYKIEKVRYHKADQIVMKLEGCDTINDALTLVNAQLAIEEKDLVKLPPNTYFHFQIIGLDVFDERGENLGKVSEIFSTGSNDVYVIQGKEEYLIPAINDVITKIDIENKKMIICLPKGLK